MKILLFMIGMMWCCGGLAQETVSYIPMIVHQPVVTTQYVPTVQMVPVRVVPMVQQMVVQNVVGYVIIPGNWPNLVVNDSFLKKPCCGSWIREKQYNY